MARLQLSFFGPYKVELEGRLISRFRSINNLGLLAYLALRADIAHTREHLSRLFWPDEDSKTARNNLRQALFQLRLLLDDGGKNKRPFLLATYSTIQFNPQSDFAIDVITFLQAVENNNLEAAADIYQAELLSTFTCDSLPFESWLRHEREFLHLLAQENLYKLTQVQLQSGRYYEAQITARRQLALEPWYEPAHRQLMKAYAYGGDRRSALTQFEACRQIVLGEIGVEPMPETIQLVAEIKSGRFDSTPSIAASPPPKKAQHNLPTLPTSLIGRDIEIIRLHYLLTTEEQRLVSIIGPGGIGKSRLALACGRALLNTYRDGVYFVDLTAVPVPAGMVSAVAAAIRYNPPNNNKPLLENLTTYLRQSHMLIILDNFEHLLSGTLILNKMLRATENLAMLVTSRQRLNLSSEHCFELGGLAYPSSAVLEKALDFTAVQLFMDAALRIRPDFALDVDNVSGVMALCKLVDGMPLGLILAAAWLELLTVEEIVEEIQNNLNFLAADLADLPPRQRSLQAVFDHSWSMLTSSEQNMLINLTVFRGAFTRDAAAEVAGADLRTLFSLVQKSMLNRQRETGRFTIHELLRQYAREKTISKDCRRDVDFAHCRYFAKMARREQEQTRFYFDSYLKKRLQDDADDIHLAWHFAEKKCLVTEMAQLARGLIALNGRKSAVDLIQRALQHIESSGISSNQWPVLCLRLAEATSLSAIDPQLSLRKLEMLIPNLEMGGHLDLLHAAYIRVAWNKDRLLDGSHAVPWIEKAQQLSIEDKFPLLEEFTEFLRLRYLAFTSQQNEGMFDQFKRLLACFEPEYGEGDVVYEILRCLSWLSFAAGKIEPAFDYGERALKVALASRDLFHISNATYTLVEMYQKRGMRSEVKLRLLAVLDWHLAIGQVWQTLGFLYAAPLEYPSIFGNKQDLIPILAMVYHHPEVVPIYKVKIDQASEEYKTMVGEEVFEAAWKQGKTLNIDMAVAQMRGMLTNTEGGHA